MKAAAIIAAAITIGLAGGAAAQRSNAPVIPMPGQTFAMPQPTPAPSNQLAPPMMPSPPLHFLEISPPRGSGMSPQSLTCMTIGNITSCD